MPRTRSVIDGVKYQRVSQPKTLELAKKASASMRKRTGVSHRTLPCGWHGFTGERLYAVFRRLES